jgi:hypothetical protein
MRRLAAALLGCAVPLAGCSVLGIGGERGRLEENRQRWQRQGVRSYEMRQEYICFCPPGMLGPVLIRVHDGVVVSRVRVDGQPTPVPAEWFGTVEDLFARVEDALDRDFDTVTVAYDPEMGYPRRIALDVDDDAVDDEMGIIAILLPLR